jgi:hypothetical protein
MSGAAEESSRSELHPAVRIGHVNLRVADGNGIELYYDRPGEEWGAAKVEPFDPRDLLGEAAPTT